MSNEHKQAAQEQQPVTAPAKQAERQPAQQAGAGVKQGKAPQPALTLSRPATSGKQDTARQSGAVPIGTYGTLFVVHN